MSVQNTMLPVLKLNLWQHQKDSITEILNYFEKYTGKAFLVKMPTGTGKTGVFACLSRIAKPDLNYLIITPSSALKKQIINELKEGFWNKIGHDKNTLPIQEIHDLLPTTATKTIAEVAGKKYIIVTTIQALQTISANKKYGAEISELKKTADCLIFDEGHKEPAFTWGETVRAFQKPTILFSATPYRNDYKIFNIDKDNFYSLEHNLCQKNNILRQLEIKSLVLPAYGHGTFVTQLLHEINVLMPNLVKQGIKEPKVIIRCETSKDIKKIVAALKKVKKKVIGIHENFSVSDGYSSEVPPQNEQAKYQFYVHQYKLIEGIDNPEFCVVALYSDFASTRLLIQQVGRVLRNPTLAANQSAYLLSLNSKKHQKDWEKYLDYDQLMNTKKKLFDITDVLKVNKEASTLYFSGAFRELIDVNNIDLAKSLLFQKKVNVLFHDNRMTFDEICEELLNEWSKRDYFVLKHDIVSKSILLILYIKYENSQIVKDGVFIEQTLAVTCLHFAKDYLFYYDSEQNNPMFAIESLEPISRDNIIKMLNAKRSVAKVFLHNTDIGSKNVRSKEIHANSVEATAPGLTDFSFFPTRMEANVNDNGQYKRRYIGFQFGRITDFSSKRIELPEFNDWIDNIRKQLSSAVAGPINLFMNRFSQKVDPPNDTTPVSILLDIDSDAITQFTYGTTNDDLSFDDLSANIAGNTFSIVLNSQSYRITIRYIKENKRYHLECNELDNDVANINPDASSLIGYMNANQSFRIIIKGNQYVYSYKNFFRPGLNLISKKKDLDLRPLFNVHNCVSQIKSEKGSSTMKASANKWHKDSLFGLISRFGKGYGDRALEALFSFDHLICDDLSNEIADFIGIDSVNKKLVLIHAKAGKSRLSASAFTEVCGQAVKNLEYLTPYFQAAPAANISRWQSQWQHTQIGKVDRIIHGGLTAKQFWNKYTGLLSDTSLNKEVWLMVGNLFDYKAFEKEINKTKIENVSPQVIQLIYLLRSTWNSISSVGAQLKIIC